MIRQAFLHDINETIAKSGYFSEHDFAITSKAKSDSVSLAIKYRYDQQYSLTATIADVIQPEQRDFEIQGNAAPGDMGVTEHFVVYGKVKFLSYLTIWLKRLRAELVAIPINRQIEEQRQQIDAILAQFENLKDEYFSVDEANAIKERLDDLERRMTEQIAENVKNKDLAEKKIVELEKEFEILRESVDILKKPGWLSSFTNRLARWVKDPNNRALLKDGTDIVKGLLE